MQHMMYFIIIIIIIITTTTGINCVFIYIFQTWKCLSSGVILIFTELHYPFLRNNNSFVE